MKIPNPFRSGKQQPSSRMFRWHATQESLSFMPNVGFATENSISAVLASNEVGSLLEQLSSEDLAETQIGRASCRERVLR